MNNNNEVDTFLVHIISYPKVKQYRSKIGNH